jgi:hypothetical protein
MKKVWMESRQADENNKYNSPMKRFCVKKATQFQSAVTGPKIYIYSRLDVIYGLPDYGPWTMVFVMFYDYYA